MRSEKGHPGVYIIKVAGVHMQIGNLDTLMSRREWLIVGVSAALTILAGLLTTLNANAVLIFVTAGVALSLQTAVSFWWG
jgi:hypothetical protein